MNFPNDTIKALTQFLFLETPITPCDIAIVLGNDYVQTMNVVSELLQNDMIKNKIIITGHSAKLDKQPEAERFYEYGLRLGIPKNKMLLETKATNSLENLLFSKQIIEQELGGFENCRSIMFVAKAFVTRRIQMTAQAVYPSNIKYVFCPTVDKEGRNIGADCWWKSETATQRVLEEMRRVADYTLKGDLSLF